MVGPAADWYAFGVMLFVSLTGTLPFAGLPPVVIEAKRTRTAPAPHELDPDVPADLDELCQHLLRREPSARPAFVGRNAELAELAHAYRRTRDGERELIIVQGEPGVGKSTLVRRFLESHVALDGEAVILAGRCYEQESVPFKAFDTVIVAEVRPRLDTVEPCDRCLVEHAFRFGVAPDEEALDDRPRFALAHRASPARRVGRDRTLDLEKRSDARERLRRALGVAVERLEEVAPARAPSPRPRRRRRRRTSGRTHGVRVGDEIAAVAPENAVHRVAVVLHQIPVQHVRSGATTSPRAMAIRTNGERDRRARHEHAHPVGGH
jgi:hypothetical protein